MWREPSWGSWKCKKPGEMESSEEYSKLGSPKAVTRGVWLGRCQDSFGEQRLPQVFSISVLSENFHIKKRSATSSDFSDDPEFPDRKDLDVAIRLKKGLIGWRFFWIHIVLIQLIQLLGWGSKLIRDSKATPPQKNHPSATSTRSTESHGKEPAFVPKLEFTQTQTCLME